MMNHNALLSLIDPSYNSQQLSLLTNSDSKDTIIDFIFKSLKYSPFLCEIKTRTLKKLLSNIDDTTISKNQIMMTLENEGYREVLSLILMSFFLHVTVLSTLSHR